MVVYKDKNGDLTVTTNNSAYVVDDELHWNSGNCCAFFKNNLMLSGLTIIPPFWHNSLPPCLDSIAVEGKPIAFYLEDDPNGGVEIGYDPNINGYHISFDKHIDTSNSVWIGDMMISDWDANRIIQMVWTRNYNEFPSEPLPRRGEIKYYRIRKFVE